MITIRSDALEATVTPLGAELQSLRDRAGREYLWDGDPAWWTGRAPILFPVVGTLADDTLRIGAATYRMAKHGFARRTNFHVIETAEDAATFRLEASEATHAAYPFAFMLDLRFALAGATISMMATLTNPGPEPLPASFGFHPAFRWPLPDGGERAEHRIHFDHPEPAPIRRIDGSGLLTPDLHPTPVAGTNLALDDSLFEDDALIFDRPASHGLHFGAPGRPGLRMRWEGLPELGIWTKPGAPYLCIEPWAGYSDPQGFHGDFRDKPGVLQVAPGDSHRFRMDVTVEAAA